MEVASANALSLWAGWAHNYLALLDGGKPIDLSAEDVMQSDMLATLCAGAVNPQTLQRAEQGLVGWCAPEVLRVHAEFLLLRRRAEDAKEASSLLQRAKALAEAHSAWAWEKRIEDTVARLQMTARR